MELYKGTQNIRFIYYYSDTTQHSKIVKAEYYHIEGWKNFEILYENGKIIEFHKEGYKVKEGIVKPLKPFLLLVLIIMAMYQSTIDEVI